jgi:hypothetical protein
MICSITRWVTAAVLGAVAVPGAAELPQFTAVYEATWNNMRLGEVEFRLTRAELRNCYVYESSTRPVGLVRMLYGSPREVSRFCVVDGQVRPIAFEYAGRREKFRLEFDWVQGIVRGGAGDRELPKDAQDRFGMQQAVRLWVLEHAPELPDHAFEFTMVDEDRMREYKLRATQRGTVKVPNGEFDAVLLERVDDTNRIVRFWLAPQRDYMPVKVESGRNGKVQMSMELLRFTRNGIGDQ